MSAGRRMTAVGAVRHVREMDRRHRHDGHHHDVGRGDREHRIAGGAGVVAVLFRGVLIRTGRHDPLGEQQRIGAQGDDVQDERRSLRDEREQVRAGLRRHPDRLTDDLAGAEQQRPGHSPDGCRPDDDRKIPPAVPRTRQVGRGEPRLQVPGVSRPDQHDADQQEREDPEGCCKDDDPDADEGEEVAQGQCPPSAELHRQACERDRAQCGAERDRGRGQARECVVTGDIGSEQRAQRHRRPEGDTAEHLPGRENCNGTSLHRLLFSDGRYGHATGRASRTGLRRMPSPETSTSTASPAAKGPTPAGVPVRITSPGSSVNTAEAYAMISSGE